jgi:phage gp36-like protein
MKQPPREKQAMRIAYCRENKEILSLRLAKEALLNATGKIQVVLTIRFNAPFKSTKCITNRPAPRMRLSQEDKPKTLVDYCH